MREPIYNGSVQKLNKPESTRPSERIEFENDSLNPDRDKCIQEYKPEIECTLFDINLSDMICNECWNRNWF